VIESLAFTILIEGIVVTIYTIWFKKPLAIFLFTSFVANLLTQLFLWFFLSLFINHYLPALFVAEGFIWLIESFMLKFFTANQLNWQNALWLSLVMNLVSFSLGFLLPF
jgi:hypothetical protein